MLLGLPGLPERPWNRFPWAREGFGRAGGPGAGAGTGVWGGGGEGRLGAALYQLGLSFTTTIPLREWSPTDTPACRLLWRQRPWRPKRDASPPRACGCRWTRTPGSKEPPPSLSRLLSLNKTPPQRGCDRSPLPQLLRGTQGVPGRGHGTSGCRLPQPGTRPAAILPPPPPPSLPAMRRPRCPGQAGGGRPESAPPGPGAPRLPGPPAHLPARRRRESGGERPPERSPAPAAAANPAPRRGLVLWRRRGGAARPPPLHPSPARKPAAAPRPGPGSSPGLRRGLTRPGLTQGLLPGSAPGRALREGSPSPSPCLCSRGEEVQLAPGWWGPPAAGWKPGRPLQVTQVVRNTGFLAKSPSQNGQ